MAETGEKYTVARRTVIAATQDGAIRGAVQDSLERAIGLSAVEIDLAADRVHVTIRADGMYVVGHDIKSGTWHTAGNGDVSGGL